MAQSICRSGSRARSPLWSSPRLLGVEANERHRFQAWSDELAAIVFSTNAGSVATDTTVHAAEEFTKFFGHLVAREQLPDGRHHHGDRPDRRQRPGRRRAGGALHAAAVRRPRDDTTLLGNAIAILCESPKVCEQLRGDPALWPSAVEEFMRTQGSARTMVRKVAIDHEREGVQFRARDNVFLSIAAANHDPAVFAEPNVLDLARDPKSPLGLRLGSPLLPRSQPGPHGGAGRVGAVGRAVRSIRSCRGDSTARRKPDGLWAKASARTPTGVTPHAQTAGPPR